MTIHELLALTGLTGSDEIPVWDAEASGEPTKKITAQNFAAAIKTLASLLGTGDVVNNLTSTETQKPGSANMLRELNNKITQYTTSSVGQSATLPTGVSLYSVNRVTIVGRICVLQFSFKLESVGSSSKVINNYLPEGTRPLFSLTAVGDSGLGDGKVQSVNIGTDGTATIYSVSPTATTYCIGTVAYILA